MIYIRGTWHRSPNGILTCHVDDIVTGEPTNYPIINLSGTPSPQDIARGCPSLYGYKLCHKGDVIDLLFLRQYTSYMLTLLEEYINVATAIFFDVTQSIVPLTTDVLYQMPRILSFVQQIGVLNRSTGMYDYVSDPFELQEMILNMG